jgi:hypothetical protein
VFVYPELDFIEGMVPLWELSDSSVDINDNLVDFNDNYNEDLYDLLECVFRLVFFFKFKLNKKTIFTLLQTLGRQGSQYSNFVDICLRCLHFNDEEDEFSDALIFSSNNDYLYFRFLNYLSDFTDTPENLLSGLVSMSVVEGM